MSTSTTCYRHPNRLTGARCTRCGRSICPDCMIVAPVGHHCPECVREANQGLRQVRSAVSDPLAVKVLIGLNVLFYMGQQSDITITRRFGMVPDEVANGQVYRMLTAAFLHASITHILFNMLALWIVGPALENALGKVRFVALYIGAALGGSLCSYFLDNPRVLGVGASGAVFGAFGAYFVVARAHRIDARQVVGLIVVNLLIGFVVPGIDNWAHIGGLIAGGALAYAFIATEPLDAPRRRAAQIAAVALLAGAIVLLTAVRTSQLTTAVGLPF